jgi:hypothetical protein
LEANSSFEQQLSPEQTANQDQMVCFRVNNQIVLTTKPLEYVVQGHSNQVNYLIEAQKGYNS